MLNTGQINLYRYELSLSLLALNVLRDDLRLEDITNYSSQNCKNSPLFQKWKKDAENE